MDVVGYYVPPFDYGEVHGLAGVRERAGAGRAGWVTLRARLGMVLAGVMIGPVVAAGLVLTVDAGCLVQELQDRFPAAELIGGDAEFERLVASVVGLVETPRLGLDLPLDVRGTAFQQRVWQALGTIPAGATVSYAELAERIGAPASARAVAGACAANILAVAIPCHRVVRSDGSLSGYRWGIERKRALLEREATS